MQKYKVIVEKHEDGYVAYPLGLKGAVVGQGSTYEEVLADVKSAIKFHIETFGDEAIADEPTVLEAFVAETGVQTVIKFPSDAPKRKVIRTLEMLGFVIVREKKHVSMLRINADGSKTPLTMPNHPTIKASTLRSICTQTGIARKDFIDTYKKA